MPPRHRPAAWSTAGAGRPARWRGRPPGRGRAPFGRRDPRPRDPGHPRRSPPRSRPSARAASRRCTRAPRRRRSDRSSTPCAGRRAGPADRPPRARAGAGRAATAPRGPRPPARRPRREPSRHVAEPGATTEPAAEVEKTPRKQGPQRLPAGRNRPTAEDERDQVDPDGRPGPRILERVRAQVREQRARIDDHPVGTLAEALPQQRHLLLRPARRAQREDPAAGGLGPPSAGGRAGRRAAAGEGP